MDKKSKTQCSQTPKNIRVDTQVKPQDVEPVDERSENGVSWNEVEDATILINPDSNSMESRG